MQTCWFIVIEVKGSWYVDCEGQSHGPFRGKDDAILEGTRLARMSGDGSRQTQLWVKDEAGQRPRRIWEGPVPRRPERPVAARLSARPTSPAGSTAAYRAPPTH